MQAANPSAWRCSEYIAAVHVGVLDMDTVHVITSPQVLAGFDHSAVADSSNGGPNAMPADGTKLLSQPPSAVHRSSRGTLFHPKWDADQAQSLLPGRSHLIDFH